MKIKYLLIAGCVGFILAFVIYGALKAMNVSEHTASYYEGAAQQLGYWGYLYFNNYLTHQSNTTTP